MASCMLLSMARCKVSSMMLFYETAYPTKNQSHVSARALSHTKASGAKKKFGSILRPSRSLTTAQPVSRARSPFSVRANVSNNIDSKTKTIIPDPDYRIAITLLGVAAALVGTDNLLSAAPVGLLGLLLLVQTTRVRFSFDKEALEVKVGANLKESGENVFVGGKNRWKYSTFTNWELWWPNFPVLVYFKETQTKPEGQVHFFPVIFNGKQLYDVLVARAGPSKTSGPK